MDMIGKATVPGAFLADLIPIRKCVAVSHKPFANPSQSNIRPLLCLSKSPLKRVKR